MNIGKFFSIRDFFNYYIAGAISLLTLALAWFWFSGSSATMASPDVLTQQVARLGPFIGGILAIILPYVTGFTLSPLCNLAARLPHCVWGDPVKWMTDYSGRGTQKHKGKRLAKPAASQVSELARRAFGYKVEDERLWFFPIRAYVVDKGGTASDLARRAYDLMNLAESLLLPVPALGGILVGGSLTQLSVCLRIILSIAVFAVLLALLARRYLRLRRYWVKHTYYAFLVLNTTEPENGEDHEDS